MITVAVIAAHPPLLLPGVTGGLIDEIEELRAVSRAAIAELADAEVVVVVGAAPTTGPVADGPLPTARYAPRAGTVSPPDPLPLSLGVGRSLLDREPVELWGIAASAPPAECVALGVSLAARPERIGLLVMADGSARRGEKAPGHLDPRAAPFDAEVAAALAEGDPGALLALDPTRADELLVAGRAAWQVLAGAFGAPDDPVPIRAELRYSADPFGVWYPVAVWRRAD